MTRPASTLARRLASRVDACSKNAVHLQGLPHQLLAGEQLRPEAVVVRPVTTRKLRRGVSGVLRDSGATDHGRDGSRFSGVHVPGDRDAGLLYGEGLSESVDARGVLLPDGE